MSRQPRLQQPARNPRLLIASATTRGAGRCYGRAIAWTGGADVTRDDLAAMIRLSPSPPPRGLALTWLTILGLGIAIGGMLQALGPPRGGPSEARADEPPLASVGPTVSASAQRPSQLAQTA